MTAAGQPEPAEPLKQQQVRSSMSSKARASMTAHAITSLLGSRAAAQQHSERDQGQA